MFFHLKEEKRRISKKVNFSTKKGNQTKIFTFLGSKYTHCVQKVSDHPNISNKKGRCIKDVDCKVISKPIF